jgi:hypothetical protein
MEHDATLDPLPFFVKSDGIGKTIEIFPSQLPTNV